MPIFLSINGETGDSTLLADQHKYSVGDSLYIMDVGTFKSALKSASLQDELRLHARYIRDTLVPFLSRDSKFTHSDTMLLRSIFRKLESTDMTLDLLRYSRIEKALMVVAATGASNWPIEIVLQAEDLIQRWEDKLGPLKNLRADIYGPGGRLEGVRKIIDGRKDNIQGTDDDAKSAWSVDVLNPSQSHRYGSLGFQVGDWWLKPAAAYRDGIIDKTAHAITADGKGAYAIVLSGGSEQVLKANGQILYRAALHDPGVFKLTNMMITDTEKVIRVLRSWKLRSNLAPKAGLRYDGLYRVESYGIRLEPPNSWHTTFTLNRLPNQPSMSTALAYPMCDQLDDWRDYQRLKIVDQGEDFAMLREILRGPHAESKARIIEDEIGGLHMERGDSGYFSRRSSKMSSRVNSVAFSVPDSALGTPPQGGLELDLKLVAEGTPTTSSSGADAVDNQYRAPESATQRADRSGQYFFNPRGTGATFAVPPQNDVNDLGDMGLVVSGRTQQQADRIHRESDDAGIDRPENPKIWSYKRRPYRSESLGLDGMDQNDVGQRTSRRDIVGSLYADSISEDDGNETILEWKTDTKSVGARQAAALDRMKKWNFKKKSVDETLTRRAVWDGAADTVEAGEEAAIRRSLAIRGE